MRELAVRLRFTTPCLGNVRKRYRVHGKIRHYFVLPRNMDTGKVVLMPTWWLATLRRAAEILCRHHKEVEKIRFALEIDGNPRPAPGELFRRYFDADKFSQHEAFLAGDLIGVTCVVPDTISDDDFLRLLNYAGKYCGMSPGHPGKYGFYAVESIRPITIDTQRTQLGGEDREQEKIEPPLLAKNGGS